jgi:uncharacterized protein
LQSKGFVQSTEVDESELLVEQFAKMRTEENMNVSVITTTDCNLGCVYCNQGSYHQSVYMTKSTANKLVSWIVQKTSNSNAEYLSVFLYGGEPLLNLPVIEIVVPRLQEYSRQLNLRFTTDMNTNGVFLVPKVATMLSAWGMKSLTICLDGPPDVHDARRPLRNRKGSFSTIFDNVSNCIDILNINIRINLDCHNYERAGELGDILEAAGLKKKITLFLAPTEQTVDAPLHCDRFIFRDADDFQGMMNLSTEFRNRGFDCRTGLISMVGASCNNLGRNTFIVDPHGNLYRQACAAFSESKELIIGNISVSAFSEKYYELLDMKYPRKCLKCGYLPFCQGGCNADFFLKSRRISLISCKKELYDRVLPLIIQSVYKSKGTYDLAEQKEGER